MADAGCSVAGLPIEAAVARESKFYQRLIPVLDSGAGTLEVVEVGSGDDGAVVQGVCGDEDIGVVMGAPLCSQGGPQARRSVPNGRAEFLPRHRFRELLESHKLRMRAFEQQPAAQFVVDHRTNDEK